MKQIQRGLRVNLWKGPVDYKRHLASEQLIGIGAITLAWNEIERSVDYLLVVALNLPRSLGLDVTSRVNGFDGKIAILKKCVTAELPIPKPIQEKICDLLSATERYKRYRDGIIHAHVVNPNEPIAETAQRRGKRDEVLITSLALDVLYSHLRAISDELLPIAKIFTLLSWDKLALAKIGPSYMSEEKEKENVEYLMKFTEELDTFQATRKSLVALPEFPN